MVNLISPYPYRITAILFFKFFWIIEKVIFILPTAPIKIWLGLWIMLPNFYGEFFMYNLLSDKLDRFEKEIRRGRNKIFAKIMSSAFTLASATFKISRPYIHTDNLKRFKESLETMLAEIENELEIRRKIVNSDAPETTQTMRDSTVLTSFDRQSLKMTTSVIKPNARAQSSFLDQIEETQSV